MDKRAAAALVLAAILSASATSLAAPPPAPPAAGPAPVQPPPAAPAPAPLPGPGHHRMSADDMQAFTEARIAGLKAGLQLTPAQEKNWPALETAMRETSRERAARMMQMAEERKAMGGRPDPLEGLRRRAKTMHAMAGDLEKLAQAAQPLYDSLDEGQKRRFGALMRVAQQHWRHAMGAAHGAPGPKEHDDHDD